MSLSVAIITHNEERNIGRCLASVKDIADEIVVVDSGSTDRTAEICRAHGARFEVHAFEGHIQQKNFALSRCTHDRVLSLDADEELSEGLRSSILSVLDDWKLDGYAMNRLTNYCGSWIRHGGWYPDRKLRLFRRSKGAWSGINPHDAFVLHESSSVVGRLKGDLLHFSYSDIGDHIRQIDAFTKITARELAARGSGASVSRMLLAPPVRFLRDYVFRAGFLDGYHGLVIAVLSASAVFIKYARVRELTGKEATGGR